MFETKALARRRLNLLHSYTLIGLLLPLAGLAMIGPFLVRLVVGHAGNGSSTAPLTLSLADNADANQNELSTFSLEFLSGEFIISAFADNGGQAGGGCNGNDSTCLTDSNELNEVYLQALDNDGPCPGLEGDVCQYACTENDLDYSGALLKWVWTVKLAGSQCCAETEARAYNSVEMKTVATPAYSGNVKVEARIVVDGYTSEECGFHEVNLQIKGQRNTDETARQKVTLCGTEYDVAPFGGTDYSVTNSGGCLDWSDTTGWANLGNVVNGAEFTVGFELLMTGTGTHNTSDASDCGGTSKPPCDRAEPIVVEIQFRLTEV